MRKLFKACLIIFFIPKINFAQELEGMVIENISKEFEENRFIVSDNNIEKTYSKIRKSRGFDGSQKNINKNYSIYKGRYKNVLDNNLAKFSIDAKFGGLINSNHNVNFSSSNSGLSKNLSKITDPLIDKSAYVLVNFRLNLTKKLSFSLFSGLDVFSMNQKTIADLSNTIKSSFPNYSTERLTSRHMLYLNSLGFAVDMSLLSKSYFNPYLGAGYGFGFARHESNVLNFNSQNYVFLNAGIDLKLSNSFDLGINFQKNFNYSLNGISSNLGANQNFSYIMEKVNPLKVGLKFSFNF